MSQLDLVIRGGRAVNPGGEFAADIGVRDGKIAQIGGEMSAANEIDASGKLILPGGIDAHVHLSSPIGRSSLTREETFTTGSAAAAAGGITTVGNMAWVEPGEGPIQALERDTELAREQTITDVFAHPILSDVTEVTLRQIPELLDRGCNTIKYFMLFEQFEKNTVGYVKATRLAGENGLLTMIHCEDYGLVQDGVAQLMKAGRSSLRNYADAHPIASEVVATQRAIGIAEATGAPAYVVHLAAQRALEACAEAAARGAPVYVETRPIYLHLTRERFDEPDGAKYVGNPPLRTQQDVDALWDGLQQGTIHTVCSDHAPWSLAQKLDPNLTVATPRAGVENLQTMLPMLYSEGVNKGRLSLSRFVEVTSTNAAKLFGLYPRKGTLAVGSDADIAIFDPEVTRTIRAEMLKSSVDYTPYEGWEVTGWPVTTIRRGEIIFQRDEIVGLPGSGRWVPRGRTQLL